MLDKTFKRHALGMISNIDQNGIFMFSNLDKVSK